jgi:hypothetical protein
MNLLWWTILGFAIIGLLSVIAFFLMIIGAYCLKPREDLSKFGRDPFEPKLRNIVPLPRRRT